jgi:7-keto-8-aminopelargonate synthetase-like enzyme
MQRVGFEIKSGHHPIVPIMLYDAKLANTMADELLKEGVYVIAFPYPVVPKGEPVFGSNCPPPSSINIWTPQSPLFPR